MEEEELKPPEKMIYHERQRLQLCLLHTLNNLFQQKDAFSRAELDTIASNLIANDPTTQSKWTTLASFLLKPHHNPITGNYDINVLITALESRGKTVVWHDRRNRSSSIELESGELMGVVVNVPVKRFRGLWRGRHWIAVRRIDGVWYDLDSDLEEPKVFENGVEGVRVWLDEVVDCGGEVLLVMHEKERMSE